MSQITADTILQRATTVLKADVDDEMVLMSIEEGKYYGANRVAKVIWNILEQPTSFEELCNKVATIFNITTSTNYREDILVFIGSLLKQKLLYVI